MRLTEFAQLGRDLSPLVYEQVAAAAAAAVCQLAPETQESSETSSSSGRGSSGAAQPSASATMPSYNQIHDSEAQLLATDKVLSKSRILQELTKAVKLVYIQSLHGTVVLDGDSWLVYWLDRALRHGLRIERHGYWGTARELSHQDTIVVIHALQNILTSIGKGRAWLYHTLSEGSFESYLACMLRDTKNLQKQYFAHALVRDADKTNQLINLLAGLENVSFTLQLDVTYLDICNYMPRRPMSGSPSGTALSLHLRSLRNSSALTSPGDSGVAIDSDMDASNETDTSSYKEEDWSTANVVDYHHKLRRIINHENANKQLNQSFHSSSDSGEDSRMSEVYPVFKSEFQKHQVIKSDIINQNLPSEFDDNNCSSLDTIKDCSMYSKKLNDRKNEESEIDDENNDIRAMYDDRSSYQNDVSGSFSFKKTLDPRNSYVINNDTNLLELSMTISDCENIEEPYSILNTINMTDTSSSILSTSSSGALVQRRQRKKKKSESKKRVSFHEDIFKMMKLDDDEDYVDYSRSFVPTSSMIRKGLQNERFSWCAHGDAPHTIKNSNRHNLHSDCYSSTSSLSIFDSDVDRKMGNSYTPNASCAYMALAERGAPEGQEDPTKALRPTIEIELEDNEAREAYIVEKQCGYIIEEPPVDLEMPNLSNVKSQGKCVSSSDWSDLESVTTTSESIDERQSSSGGNYHLASPMKRINLVSALSNESSRLTSAPLRQAPSKTSLLGRFLRSITERKFETKKDAKNKPKRSTLYIKGAKVDPAVVKQFNEELDKEVRENITSGRREFSGERISANMREIIRRNIYRDKTEELYKVYKVRSSYMSNGESKAMLAILTDKTLYLTGQKSDHTYSNQFVIPYNELDVILIGPNAQTILISNADFEMQYLFSTGSKQTTSELISHLEMAMRRSPSKPRLPAVKELRYDDMHSLKHVILAETAVHPDEKIEHYSLIHLEDDHISPPTTPCGPNKEGDLMFRPHVYSNNLNAPTSPWEAGYFVLKGGVVYMFTDNNQRLPKRAIPLKGGLCQGCRRIPNSHRPHTFEILLKPNKAYQFAAPDEYVASEWLQSFVQSASGLFDCAERREPLACSLVMTSKHLVAMKEALLCRQRGQTLSCASIEDLSAFRVPSSQQSWCILEFACREVHGSSGDWVVHFTNHRELSDFREVLEAMWANISEDNFPEATISPEDKLHRRCTDSNRDLQEAWQNLLPVSV